MLCSSFAITLSTLIFFDILTISADIAFLLLTSNEIFLQNQDRKSLQIIYDNLVAISRKLLFNDEGGLRYDRSIGYTLATRAPGYMGYKFSKELM